MSWNRVACFHVQGVPKATPRPRACVRGRRASVYDPGTADAWKKLIGLTARKHLPATPIGGPVMLDMVFYFPRPQRMQGKNVPLGTPVHSVKPDLDNLVKAVADALTRARMWRDDSQICDWSAKKFYVEPGQQPGCSIFVFVEGQE